LKLPRTSGEVGEGEKNTRRGVELCWLLWFLFLGVNDLVKIWGI